MLSSKYKYIKKYIRIIIKNKPPCEILRPKGFCISLPNTRALFFFYSRSHIHNFVAPMHTRIQYHASEKEEARQAACSHRSRQRNGAAG